MVVFRLEGEEEESSLLDLKEPEGQDRGLRVEAGWRDLVERDLFSLGGHNGRRGGRTESWETVGGGSLTLHRHQPGH